MNIDYSKKGGVSMKIGNKLFTNIVLILVIMLSSLLYCTFIPLAASNNEKDLPIYSVGREDKIAAITFDVNWCDPDYLPEILKVLDENEVKATFFVMGKWITYNDENRNKLKEIYERGHEIGNHSYSHKDFSKIDGKTAKEEVYKTNEIIKKELGIDCRLFRFPGGGYNSNNVTVVKSTNMIPIQWDVDSLDWKKLGAETEYSRVTKKLKSGSIILYHNNSADTPKNINRLIKEYKEKGYQFKTVGELIYSEPYTIDENGKQKK